MPPESDWRTEVQRLSNLLEKLEAEFRNRSATPDWFWYKPFSHMVSVWDDSKEQTLTVDEAITYCRDRVRTLASKRPSKKVLRELSDLSKSVTSVVEKFASLCRVEDFFAQLERERERLQASGDAEGLKRINRVFQDALKAVELGEEPRMTATSDVLRSVDRGEVVSDEQGTGGETSRADDAVSMALALATQLRTISIECEELRPLNAEIQKLAGKLERAAELTRREVRELMSRADFWLNSRDYFEDTGRLISKAITEMRPVSVGDIPPEVVVFVVEHYNRRYPETGLRYDASLRMLQAGGA
ncbi:MAG: hypothetical protein ACTSVT_04525 [Candidatus Thorarchaeota archaeon]